MTALQTPGDPRRILAMGGGGFTMGGGENAVYAAMAFAGMARCKTFSLDYRMMVVRECVVDRTIETLERNLFDVDAKCHGRIEHPSPIQMHRQPGDARAQQALGLALLQDGRYDDAYERYAKMLELFPRDPNALVDYGILAARLGHPEEAMDSWEKAVTVDPNQPNAHLYLATAFDLRGEPAAAARHWHEFLRSAAANPDDPAAGIEQQTSAAIQLADDQSRINRTDAAFAGYRSAISMAERAGNTKLESLALAHLADLQEKTGDVKSAADSFQRGLALDAKSADPHAEALDWFNYGQFLRRHGLPEDLVYACLLHAEQLLGNAGGTDLETVKTMRRQVESRLGNKASASQKDLRALLARAGDLPTQSF